MNEKSAKLDEAILLLMGRPLVLSERSVRLYHFLFMPTFNKPICVTLDEHQSGIDASLVILLDGYNDVFKAIWSEDQTGLSQPGLLSQQRCWEDITELTPSQENQVRELLSALDPNELNGRDKELSRVRDGLGVRIRSIGKGSDISYAVDNPDIAVPQTFLRLLRWIVGSASEQFVADEAKVHLDRLKEMLPIPKPITH